MNLNRFFPFLLALIPLCCAAAAQGPASDPATGSAPADVPAGVTSTAPLEVTQFQKIEDGWSNAVNRRDQYGLELVLSPLLVDVSANGDVTTRNQQVAQLLSNEDKTLYMTQKVVTVRMLGDLAVVNGTYDLHHKLSSGQQVDEKGVFTHVFERVHGGWQCTNSQRTTLREDTSSKQKKSNATETPFHFPLFSKGDKGPH
jgi:ketosteroid isomerase-like protein